MKQSDEAIQLTVVHLLFDKPPSFDGAKVHAALQSALGRVDYEPPTDKSEMALYFLRDHLVTLAEGKIPAQIVVFGAQRNPDPVTMQPALGQSWGWPEASSVVPGLKHSLTVCEMMSRSLPHKERVSVVRRGLRAILKTVDCKAIHWLNSQQFVDPLEFSRCPDDVSGMHGVAGFLNVRLFNIEGTNDVLMDSLGLATLGLPDIECHFHSLNENDVARVIWNTALYIYEKGDVIRDGETVPGVSPADKWRCAHEDALVPPGRLVLDLNPGPRFAAGKR